LPGESSARRGPGRRRVALRAAGLVAGESGEQGPPDGREIRPCHGPHLEVRRGPHPRRAVHPLPAAAAAAAVWVVARRPPDLRPPPARSDTVTVSRRRRASLGHGGAR
jgi:hypothetical protein